MAATVKGTANAVLATSVTLPAHAAGDLIVIFAYLNGANSAPTAPTASGTVPAWTLVQGGGGSSNGSGVWYFVATATNHTSGTWGSTGLIAVVIEGVSTASPVGGFAQFSVNGSSTAPAITQSVTDGSSCLLYFHGRRSNVTTLNAPPTGFTRRAAAIGSSGICLNTKDLTTSDGAATQTDNGNGGSRGQTLEILAAAGGSTTTNITPAGATITITGTAPSLISDSVLTPAAALVTVTGTAPTLDIIVTPPSGSLTGALITITGTAPTLTMSLVTTGATITITGGTPSTAGQAILTPAAATVTVTGTAPTLDILMVPGSETLPITGTAPTLILIDVLAPPPAQVGVTGGTPVVILPIALQPSAALISVTGGTPNVVLPILISPAKADITVSGGTATLTVAVYVAPVPTIRDTLTVRRESRLLVVSGSRTHIVQRASRSTEA